MEIKREVEEKKKERKASISTTELKGKYNYFHFLHIRKQSVFALPVSRMLPETSVFSHSSLL